MAIFSGTSGSDTLLGSAGDDTFYASGGNDRIWGGTGGKDRIVLTGAMKEYSFRDNSDGTFSLIDLRPSAPEGSITFRDIDDLTFSDGTRTIAQAMVEGVNRVVGSDGNDTLIGSAGRDELVGGAGDDRIWGSSGSDVASYSGRMTDYNIVSNGDGSYTLTDMRGGTGDGRDIVRDVEQFKFSTGTVTLSTFLTSSTAAGNVVVQGGSGDDNLLGTSGNDVLIAKGGNDHVWGGTGGIDTMVMSGRLSDYAITSNANGSYTVADLRGGSGDGIDIVRDVEQFRFADQSVSLETFKTTYESVRTNLVTGTNGNDVLLGTSGNDVILARGGNDRIWGGKDGNDTAVFTGKATDYVVTDNGNKSYTLVDMRAGAPDGTDIVRDIDTFRFADKSLSLSQVLSGNQLLVRTITGTTADDALSGANTSGLSGANTNDLMSGGAGNDTLRGGAGNDLLIADGSGSSTSAISTTTTTRTDLGNVQIAVSTTGTVTFLGETAGYQNALGCYKVDANGNMYAVKILFANASQSGSGGDLVPGQSSMSLNLEAGDKLGFFVVSNGYGQPGMAKVLSDTAGSFKFVGPQGVAGNVGTTADLKLVHVSSTGAETVVKSQYGTSIFHSTLGTNTGLNVDDFTHVTGVTRFADGSIKLGFEDLLGGGDRDYDDCVFNLQVGTANTLLLGTTTTTTNTLVTAAEGGDHLHGGLGADTLIGGAGKDILEGGLGADVLVGGGGLDTADYSRASAAVSVDLVRGGLQGEAAGDVYESVEMVIGSAFADTISGSASGDVLNGLAGNDRLSGLAGNDVLRGGVGADVMDGGDDFDTATYYDAAAGVSVDLGAGIGTRGDAAGDVLISIERVQGSNIGDDELIGSAGADELQGYGGNDTLVGGGGGDVLSGGDGNDFISGGAGNDFIVGGTGTDVIDGGDGSDFIRSGQNAIGTAGDTIDGGDGNDLIDYSQVTEVVHVDLSGNVGGRDFLHYDTLLNIEDVNGGSASDVMWGDAVANRLSGGAGNDSIRGGGGDDILKGEAGDDVLIGDAGDDTLIGGDGVDRAVYEGAMADFEIQHLMDGNWRVASKAGRPEGIDIVTASVELLVFNDTTLDLHTNTTSSALTAFDYLFQV